jgi:hypothetical protein
MNDDTTKVCPCPNDARTANLDFERDMVKFFQRRLLDAGYRPPESPNEAASASEHQRYRNDIFYKWLHVCNRIPAPRPRRIHKSSEFRVSSESLAPELKEGLELVESKLTTGETIHHHLSRRIGDLDFHDLLLDDWDIHHLHLGTAISKKGNSQGLIEGTREVAYCIFRPDDVYMVQVMNHEFYDPGLLEIVNTHWPHLLTRMPLSSARNQAGDIAASTRSSVKESRRPRVSRNDASHSPRTPLDDCPPIMAPVTLRDGTVLLPSGGSFATSGHSVRTLMAVTSWKRKLQQWEQYVHGMLDKIILQAQEHGIEAPSRIQFELRYDESTGKWVADSPQLYITVALEP